MTETFECPRFINGTLPCLAFCPATPFPIFGKVSSGLEVVQAIGQVQTGASDRPVEDVVMEKVIVTGSE